MIRNQNQINEAVKFTLKRIKDTKKKLFTPNEAFNVAQKSGFGGSFSEFTFLFNTMKTKSDTISDTVLAQSIQLWITAQHFAFELAEKLQEEKADTKQTKETAKA